MHPGSIHPSCANPAPKSGRPRGRNRAGEPINMRLIALFAILLVIAAALTLVSWKADGGWNAVATMLASVIGALIAIIGQELYRQADARTRIQDLLAALRVEVELNLKINGAGKDERRRLYSTSAWDAFRPHLAELNGDVSGLLKEGFSAAYMHRQALQVELIHANQGPALEEFSHILFSRFSAVHPLSDWMKRRSWWKY